MFNFTLTFSLGADFQGKINKYIYIYFCFFVFFVQNKNNLIYIYIRVAIDDFYFTAVSYIIKDAPARAG